MKQGRSHHWAPALTDMPADILPPPGSPPLVDGAGQRQDGVPPSVDGAAPRQDGATQS